MSSKSFLCSEVRSSARSIRFMSFCALTVFALCAKSVSNLKKSFLASLACAEVS